MDMAGSYSALDNPMVADMTHALACATLDTFRNQVLHCDAMTLLRSLPPNSIDAIISDPPYNLTELDFDKKVINWVLFWQESKRVLKRKQSPVILFSQQPFTTDLIMSNRKWFRYELIWEKTMPVGFLDANRRPLRVHENILIFGEALPDYYPVMETTSALKPTAIKSKSAKHYNRHDDRPTYNDNGSRYPRSVWKFAQRHTAFKETESLHPTQKPVSLMEKIILTYTKRGDIILDLFAGSGTTAIAARNTGRNYVLCENDPKHYMTAFNRLQQAYTVPMFA